MQTIHLIRSLYPHGHKSDQANVSAAPRTSLARGANGEKGKGEEKIPALDFLMDKILHHRCFHFIALKGDPTGRL